MDFKNSFAAIKELLVCVVIEITQLKYIILRD